MSRVQDEVVTQIGTLLRGLTLTPHDVDRIVKLARVRERALPPLPAEPHTVILTRSKKGWDDWELKLDADGELWRRTTASSVVFTPDELPKYITGFKVLAEPVKYRLGETYGEFETRVRRETAKAVVDRMRELAGSRWPGWLDSSFLSAIETEFGVTD